MFFSIKAWSAIIEDFAMPFELDEKLDQGINKYFKKVKSKFKELISITFVNNCQLVEMVYWEKEQRNL